MTDASEDAFQTCVAALTKGQDHRVWSLIVTVFGDLAQNPGDAISGAVLSRITELVGVKPQATRVALHRLRKDGWIQSERSGRTSTHRLTPFGRAQSAMASPRIFARTDEVPDRWHVLVSSGGGASHRALDELLLTGDYLEIAGNVAFGPGAPPKNTEELLVFEAGGVSVPHWIQESVVSKSLGQAYLDMHRALNVVRDALGRGGSLSTSQQVAVRTLVVHNWRRLVLRHPNLPPSFFPPGWPGKDCRRLVIDILDCLPRPGLEELEERQ